jgi:hypothetical protein
MSTRTAAAGRRGDLVVGVFAGVATTLLAGERTRWRAVVLDADPRRVGRWAWRGQVSRAKGPVRPVGEAFAEREASSKTMKADTEEHVHDRNG